MFTPASTYPSEPHVLTAPCLHGHKMLNQRMLLPKNDAAALSENCRLPGRCNRFWCFNTGRAEELGLTGRADCCCRPVGLDAALAESRTAAKPLKGRHKGSHSSSEARRQLAAADRLRCRSGLTGRFKNQSGLAVSKPASILGSDPFQRITCQRTPPMAPCFS